VWFAAIYRASSKLGIGPDARSDHRERRRPCHRDVAVDIAVAIWRMLAGQR